MLWNPVRCSDAAPPALQDPPAARPSGLPVMCHVAALSWSARVPCFPCSSRASSVCSHTACVCVCLPPCLTYRSPVFRLPVCGWRRLPVWRQRGSGGSRRHPPYPPSRPVPCICAGWCVCVLSPLGRLFFPLPRLIRMLVCLRSGCEPRGGTGGADSCVLR